jgi:hypothetical protein
MTDDPSRPPLPAGDPYPTQPVAAPLPVRPWYRRLRFMLPIGVVGGFIIGAAAAAAGSSPAAQNMNTQSATTVTTTTTAPAATVTHTQTTAKPTTPSAVAAVLKAWTDAGPQPDKQHAAMAALKRDWPTLAEALEKATGVKAPTDAAAPAPAAPSGTIPGDGTFIVGHDVKAGTYKSSTPDSGNCYWARLRDDKNTLNSIIANNNSSGQSVVTIRPSDAIFEDSGCNDWVRVK